MNEEINNRRLSLNKRLAYLTKGATPEEAKIVHDAVDRLFNEIQQRKNCGEMKPVYAPRPASSTRNPHDHGPPRDQYGNPEGFQPPGC